MRIVGDETQLLVDSLRGAKKAAKYTVMFLSIGLPSILLWIEREFISDLGSFGGLFAALGLWLGSMALFASYVAFNVFGFHSPPLFIAVLPTTYRSLGRVVLFALWSSNPLVLWHLISEVTIDTVTLVRYIDYHGYFVMKMFVVGIAAFIGAKRCLADAHNLDPVQPYVLIVPISLVIAAAISPDDGDGRVTSGLEERVVYYVGTVLSSSCGYWLGSAAKRRSIYRP